MRVEYFTQMAIGDVKPKGSTEILLASLAEEGLKPEDIDTVIYTHLHNDHAGNADLFPDAVTYVQKAEYDNMLSPYPFQKARMDYFPDTPERLSKVKRLLLVDGVVCTPSSRQRNNLHFTHENPSCIPYGAGCYAASRRSWTSIGVRTPRPRWRRWKL